MAITVEDNWRAPNSDQAQLFDMIVTWYIQWLGDVSNRQSTSVGFSKPQLCRISPRVWNVMPGVELRKELLQVENPKDSAARLGNRVMDLTMVI